MYDVIVYGAVGDGSTDDTTAIQAAIDAANGAGGGTAFFPKGVYLVTGLTLYRKVNLQGEGRNSVIKRKPGVNADVVKSYRFANLDTPIDSFYVADLSIDGNYGQFGADAFGSGIGGSGLLINGNGWVLRNVTIRNCKDFGWRNVDLPSGSSPPSGDDPGAWQIYAS